MAGSTFAHSHCSRAQTETSLCGIQNLQPRTRTSRNRPRIGEWPGPGEHESVRKGALNLFATFDTRTGRVLGVEQWFSILQRKRLGAPHFADLADLEDKILAFIAEWTEIAHPFNWDHQVVRQDPEQRRQPAAVVVADTGPIP